MEKENLGLRAVSAMLGKIFVDFFNFLAQFIFTTSGKELDYYHQKVNVRVASQVFKRLKTGSQEIRKFYKANLTKCHFFLSLFKSAPINITGFIIKSSNLDQHLGINTDSNFGFEEHVNILSKS